MPRIASRWMVVRSALRPRLTYANVMATIAVFAALGGSATAAKFMISGKQIKNGSITGKDIKKKSVPLNRLRQAPTATPGATGAKGERGDAGPQGTQGTQGIQGIQGPAGAAATALWVVVNPGVCSPICTLPRSSGVSGVTRTGTGTFTVTFDQDVSNCAYLASIGQTEGGSLLDGGQISVLRNFGNSTQVFVYTFSGAAVADDRWFHMAALC